MAYIFIGVALFWAVISKPVFEKREINKFNRNMMEQQREKDEIEEVLSWIRD